MRHNYFDTYGMVKEFHEKFQVPLHDEPTMLVTGLFNEEGQQAIALLKQAEGVLKKFRSIPTVREDVAWGRIQMIIEEVREFAEAVIAEDIEGQADSLVDIDYFVLGTAGAMGLPWYRLFHEVHDANMRKERVTSVEQSTRLNKLDCYKPEGWVGPDIKGVLDHATKVTRLLKEHPLLRHSAAHDEREVFGTRTGRFSSSTLDADGKPREMSLDQRVRDD